ncbi:MAG TPA: hypothetical protein VFL42_06040 [Terriglobales bacterium]|nr:hypothetical protein [Terriglobales bacterium]
MKTSALLLAALVLAAMSALSAQSPQPTPTPQAGPSPSPTPNNNPSFVTDGGAGPCSAEFTVTGTDGKPVFAALISVRIAYGLGGLHKLDMSVYTSQEGKGKFTGIPARVKKPPLEFKATKDQLVGIATVDPAAECAARHDIILDKPKPTPTPTIDK